MATGKVNAKIELQFGDKAIGEDQLVAKAKESYGKKDIKNLDKAYYVVNNDVTGNFDL